MLSGLEYLSFQANEVSWIGLGHLSKMHNLSALNAGNFVFHIARNKISNRGAEVISKMSYLRYLCLSTFTLKSD
jgi:hypothetical protein